MKKKSKSQINEHKGKLIYKSITPKKKKRTTTLALIMILFFTGAGSELYLFIFLLIHGKFPAAIFPTIMIGIGSIPTFFLGFAVGFLLLRQFLTYLHIYEKGVEILRATYIPPKIKREYITFEDIKEVEVKEDMFQLNTLYIHVEDKDAYELNKFEISNLQDAKNLITKHLENKKME